MLEVLQAVINECDARIGGIFQLIQDMGIENKNVSKIKMGCTCLCSFRAWYNPALSSRRRSLRNQKMAVSALSCFCASRRLENVDFLLKDIGLDHFFCIQADVTGLPALQRLLQQPGTTYLKTFNRFVCKKFKHTTVQRWST